MNKIDPDEDEDEDGNPIPSTKQPSSYRARAQTAAQELAQQYNNNQNILEQMTNASLGPGTTGPARSNHQPHQQAYLQYQQQQQLQRPSQAMPPTSHHHRDRQSSRSREKSKSNHTDYSSMEGMVLDPETGEMVPQAEGFDDDDSQIQVLNEKQPVVIKLGQLTSKHAHADNSTQVCVCRVHSLTSSRSSSMHPFNNVLSFQGGHRVPKLTINLGGRIDGSNGGLGSSKKHHHKHRKHKKSKKKHRSHGDSDEDDEDIVELSNDSDADYRV